MSTCEGECVCLAGILSSPLLAGLLPVCKLLAVYGEANEVREAAWATVLSSLQGMAPVTGLHSPGQLGCTWPWATGGDKSGFKPLLFLGNEAGKWRPCPQPSSSQTSLPFACCVWFPGSSGTQPYPTYISLPLVRVLCGRGKEMGNTATQLVDPPMAEGVTGRRHLSVLLLAGALQKRGRILDRDPRRSPCLSLCLKAGSHMSELPLTAVCVICSLKPLMMEILQSP